MSHQFKPNIFQQKTFFQGYLSSAMLKDIHNSVGILQYQQQSFILGSNIQQQSGSGVAIEQHISKRSISSTYSPLQRSNQKRYNQHQNEYENLGLAIAIGPYHVLCTLNDILINDAVVREDQLHFVCQNREYKVRQILYQNIENIINECINLDEDQGKQKQCEYAVLILQDELQEYVGLLQIENHFNFLQDYDQYNGNKCIYALSDTFLLERFVQDIRQNTIYVEQIEQLEQICPVYIHMDSNQTSSPLLIGFYKSVNKFKQGIIQLFDSTSYLQILSWVQGFQQISYISSYKKEQQHPYENLQYITKEVLYSEQQMNGKNASSDSKSNLYKQDCVWKLQRLNHRVMCSSTGDFKLKIWDSVTNTLVRVLDLGSSICRDIICFNDTLLCACDNILQIFNWETGQIIQKLTFKDKIQCLGHFESHLDVVATGHQNGYIHILKYSKRKNQWQAIQVIKNSQYEQHGHDSFINSIVGLKNYEMASAGTNGQIKIWNWQTGEFVKELQAHLQNKSVYFMKYLPDRDTIISGGSDKSVRVWDLKNNQFREYNFKNPLYSVELLSSNYLCVGDGQEVIIYDIAQNISTVIHTTHTRINSILKINPACFAVGDTAGHVTLFKYQFNYDSEQQQYNNNIYFNQNSNQYNDNDNPYSQNVDYNKVQKSPVRAIAETFCQNEKSGQKSQYQTESHPISSLASPLEYNTKQSQPPSNQPQDSSLLVQVNNIHSNVTEMNSNILYSNRSNLKKSEVITTQLKRNLSNNQLLKEYSANNNSSSQTTNRNENKYSFQENPLSSNFGQLSSNFTTVTTNTQQQTGSSNNNIMSQCLQDQQQELIERREVTMNEQNVFRLKLEDRDEQLKKTHQKYNKLFEQTFMILENYEANKIVLQHLKKDFEAIQSELKRYFANMDSIYVKQVKNLETIIMCKDKETHIQVKLLEEALQNKQSEYDDLEKSYNSSQIKIHTQEEDINKKNAYIDLLSKQIDEKDIMIISSQDRIKELLQLVNDLQTKISGRQITKITTPLKETPRNISFSTQRVKENVIDEKENLASITADKPIYSYRNSNKNISSQQNTDSQQQTSSPKIPAILSSTKILKNAQYPPKIAQTLDNKTLESSQTDVTFISSSNTNKTEKILQNNQILHTPIKKTLQGQVLKMDDIINSLKLTSRDQIDQQDIYESLSYKINNQNKSIQGITRSKSYSKPSSITMNSQNTTLHSNNIHQNLDNSIQRGVLHSRNATPEGRDYSSQFESSQQKQVLKNNISILNHMSNTCLSPIKSQFSPLSKTNSQVVIKTPQPTKISTQSREDLMKFVNDPQPPSLQQVLQTASDIENTYSRQSFETNKFNQHRDFKSIQQEKQIDFSEYKHSSNQNPFSKFQDGRGENVNPRQSFETNKLYSQKDFKSNENERFIQNSEKVSEKVIPSKVGNIKIQSRIIRNSQQNQS